MAAVMETTPPGTVGSGGYGGVVVVRAGCRLRAEPRLDRLRLTEGGAAIVDVRGYVTALLDRPAARRRVLSGPRITCALGGVGQKVVGPLFGAPAQLLPVHRFPSLSHCPGAKSSAQPKVEPKTSLLSKALLRGAQ